MKKALLLLLIFPIAFVACSDDDDNKNKDPLLGTWQYVSSDSEVKTANDKNDLLAKEIADYINKEAEDEDIKRLVFYANGYVEEISIYRDNEPYVEEGTYKIKKDSMIVLDFAHQTTKTYIFRLKDNSFKLIDDQTEDWQSDYELYYEEQYPNVEIKNVREIQSYMFIK